ncbi:hypothetical protein [Marinimicrobium sp. C2-29]|uniref:hypothetical protein n=1 Tax=Marinimicrobium sp. C2-29 TaxID=3139825 RepID=UPI00313895F5
MQHAFFSSAVSCLLLVLSAATSSLAHADKESKIRSAMSAAPPSIAESATIRDWPSEEGGDMTLLREGSNEWTCLPDMPHTPGNDPMCLDEPWLAWADAWMNKSEPKIDRMGFGYMLQGGTPESNTDPYAEGPTPDNEWIEEPVPHLMILVPDDSTLEGLPTEADDGGPWVMWRDTPYVHIMAPMPKYEPEGM